MAGIQVRPVGFEGPCETNAVAEVVLQAGTLRCPCEAVATTLGGGSAPLANAANTTSLVYHGLPEVNWAGFYFFKGGQLVVGPFQGELACSFCD